jgi:hypothetical protein
MAKLKPWFHVTTRHEDLREGRPLDASELQQEAFEMADQRLFEVAASVPLFSDRR